MGRTLPTLILLLLLASPASAWTCEAVGATVGVAGAALLAPVVLPAFGFTSAGIAAGSLAASAMSTAATTGFGMGLVAAAQSAAAAGIGVKAYVLASATGASVGQYLCDKS